jgi:hypothetical protein
MSIWNKILLGVILAASLAMFYMAMRTLQTHRYWGDLANRFDKKIKDVEQQNRELEFGTDAGDGAAKPGIRQLELAIQKLTTLRGRVWYNCLPQQPNPQTGQVRVATDLPDPSGIAVNSVLYVFEEAEVSKGGRYIGEFKVDEVAEKLVALKPARKLVPWELQQLTESVGKKGSWVMYEQMPVDNHELLARLSEAEKKALLPADSVEDYLRDGQPATWEQMDEWGVKGLLLDDQGNLLVDKQGARVPGAKGVYSRQLRDYGTLLEDFDRQRTLLFDLREATERDKKLVQDALAQAQAQIQACAKDIAETKADVAKLRAERDAVAQLHDSLNRRAADLRKEVTRLIEANQGIAGQIAKIQLDATRKIDARTRAVVQSAQD